MLTLDATTLFFYSRILDAIDSDEQSHPSKKRKSNLESNPITAWAAKVPLRASPAGRPAGSVSKKSSRTNATLPPPSLTAGSTRTSTASVLTNGIKIKSSVAAPAKRVKKEAKEPRIEVGENGIFSDEDETMGVERDAAVSSPLKRGQRVYNTVCI